MFVGISIVHEHDYYNIALTLRNYNNKHIYNIFNRLDCANINEIICANRWCKHKRDNMCKQVVQTFHHMQAAFVENTCIF